MNSSNNHPSSTKLRTFIPQLGDVRRVKERAYEGKLGAIGSTPASRYRLVALAAFSSLAIVVGSSLLNPYWSAASCVLLALLIAGGWPAATGVAELGGRVRITSHSLIIVLVGLFSIASTVLGGGARSLDILPAIAAVGIVASFMVELGRGEGAVGRLESTISCISGVLAAVSVAGWVGISHLYQEAGDTRPILAAGIGIALVLGVLGSRMISAGPKEGPRRGAVTLGVTPVAFVGVFGYVSATFLTIMVG